MIPHVIEARHTADYRVWLRFQDGLEGEIDLGDVLWVTLCFEKTTRVWLDEFAKLCIGPEWRHAGLGRTVRIWRPDLLMTGSKSLSPRTRPPNRGRASRREPPTRCSPRPSIREPDVGDRMVAGCRPAERGARQETRPAE